MKLVRDVLDKQVSDRRGTKMGRVDGIVLEIRDGEPPRVCHVEVGGAVPWRRLGPRAARLAAALRRVLGPPPREPTRVPWDRLARKDNQWLADLDIRETPAYAWEAWLQEHVVRRLGGGEP